MTRICGIFMIDRINSVTGICMIYMIDRINSAGLQGTVGRCRIDAGLEQEAESDYRYFIRQPGI